MALTSSEMSPADIAAVTNNNGNDGMWGGNWSWQKSATLHGDVY